MPRKARIFALAVALLAPLTARGQAAHARGIKVHVRGMVCEFCAQGLTKTFRAQKGVLRVEARLEDGVLILQIEERAALSDQTIEELVKDAGFDVVRIEPAAPTT